MALNGLQQQKLDKLRLAIKAELAKCKRGATPNICSQIKTAKGFAYVLNEVTKRCIIHRMTPYEVIGLYESELNEK